uniref:Uncharacterized protein n=1 Tax=Triticum urartu TaxID=4572 RepID=A0A8R7R6G0_TRIUA
MLHVTIRHTYRIGLLHSYSVTVTPSLNPHITLLLANRLKSHTQQTD